MDRKELRTRMTPSAQGAVAPQVASTACGIKISTRRWRCVDESDNSSVKYGMATVASRARPIGYDEDGEYQTHIQFLHGAVRKAHTGSKSAPLERKMDTQQLKKLAGRIRAWLDGLSITVNHSQSLDFSAAIVGLRNWPEVLAFPDHVRKVELDVAAAGRLAKRVFEKHGQDPDPTMLLAMLQANQFPSPSERSEPGTVTGAVKPHEESGRAEAQFPDKLGQTQLTAPYDSVGIDVYKLDCVGSILINDPVGQLGVPTTCVWLALVLEQATQVILGNGVSIGRECSAGTIESALKSALTAWQPRKLKDDLGMTYLPYAGFPTGVFPELASSGWGTLTMDNQTARYATVIAEQISRRIGCSVTYGANRFRAYRAAMEHVAQMLGRHGFQRSRSTLGTTRAGDSRHENSLRQTAQGSIDLDTLMDVIDVALANYNVTTNQSLGNRAPLEALRDHLYQSPPTFKPRPLPPTTACQPELGVVVEQRTVRGNKGKGRRPHVCVDWVNYTSPLLENSIDLIGRQLLIHIDESDMRRVHAYLPSGQDLGLLDARAEWGRIPHGREMRRLVNSLRDPGGNRNPRSSDPIESMLASFANRARLSRSRRTG